MPLYVQHKYYSHILQHFYIETAQLFTGAVHLFTVWPTVLPLQVKTA